MNKNRLHPLGFFGCTLLLICLVGCRGNSIRFDIGQQQIVSCSGRHITHFELETDSQTYVFRNNPNTQGQDVIKLNELKKNHFVEDAYPHSGDTSFVLKPNTEYKFINRSEGDAAYVELSFSTDGSGRVKKASRTKCN